MMLHESPKGQGLFLQHHMHQAWHNLIPPLLVVMHPCSISLARCQCVCKQWRNVAASDALWRRHARVELGCTALPPSQASFRQLFRSCQVGE